MNDAQKAALINHLREEHGIRRCPSPYTWAGIHKLAHDAAAGAPLTLSALTALAEAKR